MLNRYGTFLFEDSVKLQKLNAVVNVWAGDRVSEDWYFEGSILEDWCEIHFQLSSTPLNLFNCLQVDLDAFVHTGDPLRNIGPARFTGIKSWFSTLPLHWRLEMNQVWNFLSTRRHLGGFGGHTGVAKFNISRIESREPCILNLAPNCP